jgi:hypothetical protein
MTVCLPGCLCLSWLLVCPVTTPGVVWRLFLCPHQATMGSAVLAREYCLVHTAESQQRTGCSTTAPGQGGGGLHARAAEEGGGCLPRVGFGSATATAPSLSQTPQQQVDSCKQVGGGCPGGLGGGGTGARAVVATATSQAIISTAQGSATKERALPASWH